MTDDEIDKTRVRSESFIWNNTTAYAVAIILALVLSGMAGNYLWEQHKRRLAAQPAPSPSPSPVATAVTVQLTPEMLRVSSTSLGSAPLAVVNGKRVTEGDSLPLHTSAGEVILRVVKIGDGVVQFEHGGQSIEAKLRVPGVAQSPH